MLNPNIRQVLWVLRNSDVIKFMLVVYQLTLHDCASHGLLSEMSCWTFSNMQSQPAACWVLLSSSFTQCLRRWWPRRCGDLNLSSESFNYHIACKLYTASFPHWLYCLGFRNPHKHREHYLKQILNALSAWQRFKYVTALH